MQFLNKNKLRMEIPENFDPEQANIFSTDHQQDFPPEDQFQNQPGFAESEIEKGNELANEGLIEQLGGNLVDIVEDENFNEFGNFGSENPNNLEPQRQAFQNLEKEISELKGTENFGEDKNPVENVYENEQLPQEKFYSRASSKFEEKNEIPVTEEVNPTNFGSEMGELEEKEFNQDLKSIRDKPIKKSHARGPSEHKHKEKSKAESEHKHKKSENLEQKFNEFETAEFGKQIIQEIVQPVFEEKNINEKKDLPKKHKNNKFSKKRPNLAPSESSASDNEIWKVEFPSQDLVQSISEESHNDQKIKELELKLKQYEMLFKKQNQELENLRKQLREKKAESLEVASRIETSSQISTPSQQNIEKKFNSKPMLPEEYEFWKTSEEKSQGSYKEPTKLDEIASLKDLWIVSMEKRTPSIEQTLSNNRKSSGFKQNPLTKPNNRILFVGKNQRDKSLPKLNLDKPNIFGDVRKSNDSLKAPQMQQRKSSVSGKPLLQIKQ
ncbi:unnamed protein product [Blepharisma stoltei]|uniref:Uncharacterized protein n=1 Tax=Blepharisma stoltei TaxID=1481888 RepID=A0AAU9J2I6_9CILI|nr:unnamed protein product [Blepharisma stoltei]